MLSTIRSTIAHRTLTGSLMLAGALTACSAQAASVTMLRDPGCGCCLAWAAHLEEGGTHTVKTVDRADMAQVKVSHGVPAQLQSCHTAMVEGYVIEGHVPAADIERLLVERPEGVNGLAVAGMPMGSPGMEYGDHRQAYQVIAFGPAGENVWSEYPGTM
ncbi:MAG: DUF411 domain-containing protein [Alteraurantiacibacter sp.]